ncbi:hypothetical protein MMC27_006332 [Xylographa pallens]|nr:hypothetical protein [Xylographa pallens]
MVATTDTTPYICVLDALRFREIVCGGEEQIRQHCQSIVRAGAHRIADILETTVMNNKTGSLHRCCFANVRLPLTFAPLDSSGDVRNGATGAQLSGRPHKTVISIDQAPEIVKWISDQTFKEYDTAIQTRFHNGNIWVRLSGQIYTELVDFDRAGYMLKGLCDRVVKGEGRQLVNVGHGLSNMEDQNGYQAHTVAGEEGTSRLSESSYLGGSPIFRISTSYIHPIQNSFKHDTMLQQGCKQQIPNYNRVE